MTDEFFYTQIDRLTSAYGERSYPAERIRALKEKMWFLENDEMHGLVTEIISEFMTAPAMSKIQELLKTFQARRSEEKSRRYRAWLASLPVCSMCGNSGMIRATEKVGNPNKYTVAFSCTCIVGVKTKLPHEITWNEEKHSMDYTPEWWASGRPIIGKQMPLRAIVSSISKPMPKESA